jgi:hypothetical protein
MRSNSMSGMCSIDRARASPPPPSSAPPGQLGAEDTTSTGCAPPGWCRAALYPWLHAAAPLGPGTDHHLGAWRTTPLMRAQPRRCADNLHPQPHQPVESPLASMRHYGKWSSGAVEEWGSGAAKQGKGVGACRRQNRVTTSCRPTTGAKPGSSVSNRRGNPSERRPLVNLIRVAILM